MKIVNTENHHYSLVITLYYNSVSCILEMLEESFSVPRYASTAVALMVTLARRDIGARFL